MKDVFPEYYRPNDEALDDLIRTGTIILDANVMLDIYRLPQAGREALLALLDSVKGRLWIPYQYALEYQANRLKVISDQLSDVDKVARDASAGIKRIRDDIRKLELQRRGIDLDEERFLEALDHVEDFVRDATTKTREASAVVDLNDPLREKLDVLLSNRVGPPPESQQALAAIYAQGAVRYESETPPGWRDAYKGTGKAPTVFLAGLEYQRQFGDLVGWTQILDHVSNGNATKILLVTSEKKEDWWLDHSGRTMGPQPALIHEIRKAGATSFWMYRLPQFLDHGGRAQRIAVSPVAQDQVNELSALQQAVGQLTEEEVSDLEAILDELQPTVHKLGRDTEVLLWLNKEGYVLVRDTNREFDCVLSKGGELYDLKIFSSSVADRTIRTLLKRTLAGGWDEFSKRIIVFVEAPNIRNPNVDSIISSFASSLLKLELLAYSRSLTIIAGQLRDNSFHPLNVWKL